MSIDRIEALVRILTPPVCREHVLGDLRERVGGDPSGQSWRYGREAALTLPAVLWSQMRRRVTIWTAVEALLTLGSAYLAFYGAPARSARLVVTQPHGLASLGILTLIAVATSVAVDVFAPAEGGGTQHLRRRMMLSVAVPFLANLIVSRVASGWALPLRPTFLALLFAAGVVMPLRMLRAKNDRRENTADRQPWSVPKDVEGLERQGRRGTVFALVLGISLAGFFGRLAFVVPGLVPRAGAGLTVIGALYLTYQMLRMRPRARLPGATGDERSTYRAELVRRRDFHGGAWFWWRLAAITPGPLIMMIGRGLSSPEQLRVNAVPALFFLVFVLLSIPLNLGMGRQYQRRIDEIDGLESY